MAWKVKNGWYEGISGVDEITKERVGAALSKIDWDKMSSHFQSEKSRLAFDNLCLHIRSNFYDANSFSLRLDGFSSHYYKLYHETAARQALHQLVKRKLRPIKKVFKRNGVIVFPGLMLYLTGIYAWKKAADLKRELP